MSDISKKGSLLGPRILDQTRLGCRVNVSECQPGVLALCKKAIY